MDTFINIFHTFVLSTLRTMLTYKKSNNMRIPTMSLLFTSLSQHFTTLFLGLLSVWTATYFQDATHPDLEFTSIRTLSKSLSDLSTCELRAPKGFRANLIYFKTPTH